MAPCYFAAFKNPMMMVPSDVDAVKILTKQNWLYLKAVEAGWRGRCDEEVG